MSSVWRIDYTTDEEMSENHSFKPYKFIRQYLGSPSFTHECIVWCLNDEVFHALMDEWNNSSSWKYSALESQQEFSPVITT